MKLVVAEKPSVANAIAPVIGANVKKSGFYEGNGYIVSWCYGHLVGLLLPAEYRDDWSYKTVTFELLPMFPETWRFHITKGCEEQFGVLKKLMQDSSVTEIICATDADREGECIFRYVYNLVGCRKLVMRLWTSSLEESAIKDGLSKMKPANAYDSLFQAGFSRAKADWLIGMNASSLFGKRYHSSLHIGRVKTPTLAMIVQRDYDVAHFVKQKYYTVGLNCGSFTADSERIDDESKASKLVGACNTQGSAVLAELKKEIKTENPPKLFDLTTLQREANKHFGYTASQKRSIWILLHEKMRNVSRKGIRQNADRQSIDTIA